MIENVVCLTGHRPKNLPWGYDESKESCLNFKKEIKLLFEELIKKGKNCFLSGMAEGFDMIALDVLIELKDMFSNINIIAVVPCCNQEVLWSKYQQNRYKNLLLKCDKQIVLSDVYTKKCMFERNRYMIESASTVVACYNGMGGGTRNTIRLAQKYNRKVYIVNPNRYV